MKKIYISFAAAMLAAQAFAVDPAVYPDFQITGLSPDGRIAVSELYGNVDIIDLTTGEITSFTEGDMGATSYSTGIGNYVSNTGIVLGSTFDNLNAAYYQNGEWKELSVPNPAYSNMANGITPDGLRICGSVGGAAFSPDSETIMLVPAVWNLQENGEYSDAVILPYPEVDFSGRTPQYITAIAISENGRVVAGQIRDYSGGYCEPIVYTLNDDNVWEYSLPARHLLNPDNVEFPIDPGDGPEGPSYENFMTPEELEAYNEAVNEYWMTFEGEYPDPFDYMTPEELAAYNEVLAEYQIAYEEWAALSSAFYEVFNAVTDNAPSYVFNQVILSGDGKTYIAAQEYVESDMWTWPRIVNYAPAVFNLENGEVNVYDKEYNVMPMCITSSNTILGYSMQRNPDNFVAKVWPADAEAPVTLYSYMQNANANTAAWMNENMVHDVLTFDPDTWEDLIIEDLMITGVPHATPDMSVIATHVENFFEDSMTLTYSYILPAAVETGVKAVESKELAINALPGSVILVKGNASSIKVYDLNGRNVFEAANANGALSTGLNAGVYVVKATDAQGNSIVRKVRF